MGPNRGKGQKETARIGSLLGLMSRDHLLSRKKSVDVKKSSFEFWTNSKQKTALFHLRVLKEIVIFSGMFMVEISLEDPKNDGTCVHLQSLRGRETS